jgi:hypothetical protein
MKKRRLLTIFMTVVAALAVTGVAFAFSATNLTGTGTIAVAADETYTLSDTALAFTPVSGYDETFNTTATITIDNTGDTDINGFDITWLLADNAQVTWDTPALAVAPTGGYPILAGSTGTTLTFTLSGTLSSTEGSFDLSTAGNICTITPTS